MHVAYANPLFVQILRQVLGHAFGQCRGQHPHAIRCNAADFIQKVIHLCLNGPNFDDRVQKACGADDLFCEYAACLFDFPSGWSS